MSLYKVQLYSRDLLVVSSFKMAAQFFGNIGGCNESSRDGNHHDGNNHRSIAPRLDDRQEYQSTMLAFSKMSRNVDRLTMEMAAMKVLWIKSGTSNAYRHNNNPSRKGSGMLPEGLSIRINVWGVH